MNGIYLNDELLPLLEIAYHGMPIGKQQAVETEIKLLNISREQAIFNEIANPRIRMYARAGEEMRDQEIEKAIQVLRGLGVSADELKSKLK